MTFIARIDTSHLVVGRRYWMRHGSKLERRSIREAEEEYCGFCRTHRDDQPRFLKWTKLLVDVVPLNSPLTPCCQRPEEPPPGSFALLILSGGGELNHQERWCIPQYALLLAPCELPDT